MHFCGKFTQKLGIKTEKGLEKLDGYIQYLLLNNQKGLYVGDTLDIINGEGGWWGEGDEHIYIDNKNDQAPSHVGTGTEDYYNYSYGGLLTTFSFSFPFHSQPYGKGNNAADDTVDTRVRSLDAIPFENYFKFMMEVQHWKTTTIDYSVGVYWYQLP